ncbi:MAG: UDP-N-acetylmuramoyl-tripeptide--D-alanyl-D-alanine ligase [Clostridia bacterium]|nr:UDP-N-acetylmuramoyl-tripeptide--D-alanyl-D-alanine ligase [Clostridia bacterium]
MKMTVRSIIEAAGAQIVSGDVSHLSRTVTHVITDTRILPSDPDIKHAAFLALKGETFDGNTFAPAAAALGVGLVICERFEPDGSAVCTDTVAAVCEDTLRAYGRIAAAHRRLYKGTVIGITGSVGKTTTKEFVYGAVSSVGSASKTKANFNNDIGVPKTVLDIGDEKTAVVEMGMRGRGQIEYLVDIVRPDIAIVTNIGFAHIELLGTIENTLRAKLEIASRMDEKGILILNGDDGLLADRANVLGILNEAYGARPEIFYYGSGQNARVMAQNVEAEDGFTAFDLRIDGRFIRHVTMSMRGRHNVYAALAAISAVYAMTGSVKTVEDSVIPAVSVLTGEAFGRQKTLDAGGVTVIDDCYNAGPESVKAQLESLAMRRPADGHKRVAVLGDMLELGDEAERLHREVASKAVELGIDRLICVGRLSSNMDAGCFRAAPGKRSEFFYFDDSEACAREIVSLTEPGDVVLVKGSHGMHMEKVTEALIDRG